MRTSNKYKDIIAEKIYKSWKLLGPGFITGSSDDDPSGIATYSQAGAGFGLMTLWTAFITFPMMVAIQEMCARIGLVTSQGLTTVIKKNYPRPVLYLIAFLSFPAITFNIGADLAGMSAVANLLIPQIPIPIFSIIFVAILAICLILFSYRQIASTMKWLCLSLLVYCIVPFLVEQDWNEVLLSTLIPKIEWSADFFLILVAILGTTISPYLFFWQTSMSVEDRNQKKREDVNAKEIKEMHWDIGVGMFFSNLVMFSIILTTGSVLFTSQIIHIETVDQAALALKPLTGEYAYILFASGVIGTGFLAIPVLAGSLSYIIAEIFNWPLGMNKKLFEAKGFYITMLCSMSLALMINLFNISPIKALIYTALVYGITAPVLIAVILHICNNKKIMGSYTNSKASNIFGISTLILMTGAAIILLLRPF